MIKLKGIFLFFFVAVVQVIGQPLVLNFDQLFTPSSLSNNTVYSITEDDLGFLWIGTKKGLNRYDGYEFKTYPIPSPNGKGVFNPTIFSLLIDQNKQLWIGLKDGGLIVYDIKKGVFRSFPFTNNSTVDWTTITVKSLFEDSRGRIWIGTYGGGAIVLNKNREVIHHFCTYCDEGKSEKLSNDFVFDFVESKDGDVFIATAGKGINLFHSLSTSIEIIHSIYPEDMNSFGKTLCLDLSSTLWIGTEGNGVYTFNAKSRKWNRYQAGNSLSHLSTNIIKDIQVDKNEGIWLATDGGGLHYFDPLRAEFKRFQYSTANFNLKTLSTNALYDLHFDKSGNLWIGTYNRGINMLKGIQRPFFTNRNYDEELKMGLRSVLAIKEDNHKTVWLGTDGGGLFFFDADKESLTLKNANQLLRTGVFNEVITCLQPDNNEGLWYGSFANGLYYFNKKNGTIKQFLHQDNDAGSLAHNNVWDIEIDKSGGLWIGTLGGGIDYLPKNGSDFEHLKPIAGALSDVQIIDILLDKQNKYLWIATENKGLNRLDIKTKSIKQYFQNLSGNSIQSNNLQFIFEDHDSNIWLLSDNGLDKIDPQTEKITPFKPNYKFPIGQIYSLQEDEKGYMWLSTSKGFHRVDTKNNTLVEIGVEPNRIGDVYSSKAAVTLKNGQIVFGGVNGFSVIDPQQLQLNIHQAFPVFTDLELLNESVGIGLHKERMILDRDLNAPDAKVRLSYLDRGIGIKISSTEFTDAYCNKFAYKLQGFDKEWHYLPSDQRTIYFSNLRGGNYELQIKAANSSGVWNETPRTLKIAVQPPFWATAWFISCSVSFFLFSFYSLYKFLLRRKKEAFELQILEQEQNILKKEQEILQMRNENLIEEVTRKKAQLNASILQVAHKNEFLTVLKGRIKKIKEDSDESAAKPLRSVVNIINTELSQDDYWEQFKLVFDATFQDFIHLIEKKYPMLTPNDHRLCCFIKMKLNNREIASILNITLDAVEQAKYRLKKKIELDKEENLNEFLQVFGNTNLPQN